MTIQDLGSIGEFVAAIATLITLVYLAIQIRQNSRTLRVTAYQSFNQAGNQALAAIAQGPSPAETFTKGFPDIHALSPPESFQFITLVVALFNTFQTSYFQHRDGVFPDDLWRRQRGVARWWMSQPGVRSAMKIISQGYDPGFMQEVTPRTPKATERSETSPAAQQGAHLTG